MPGKGKTVASPRKKTAAGAHGGGNEYEALKVDDKFTIVGETEQKKEPQKMGTPRLNKEAGYNK